MTSTVCSPCVEGRHDDCETDPCGEPNCDHFICGCECRGQR